MKIVHVSSAHTATDVRIFIKECQALHRAGHDVSFVVPHPRDEVLDGVRILGVPKRSGRLGRFARTGIDLLRRALATDAAVYHLHDPDLLPLIAVLKLAGKRVIYDAHEEIPKQILSKPWIAPGLRFPIASLAGALEKTVSRIADGIVAATPPIARRFQAAKTVVVQNFPIPGEFDSRAATPYSERLPLFVYLGGISAIRGVREMIGALERLPPTTELRLALAGRFEDAALELECRMRPGWKRIDAMGFVGRGEVAALLGRSRAGLVLLHPVPNYVESYPTKLFEYMATGTPVIASDFPLWREIIAGSGCGLLVDPLDSAAIARAMTFIIENPTEAAAMGKRGRAAVTTRFGWPAEEEKLLRLYRALER